MTREKRISQDLITRGCMSANATTKLAPPRCAACKRVLGFGMRARCVFECGAWYCRRGQECRIKHAQACDGLRRLREADPDHA